MVRRLILLVLILAACALAGCGSKSDTGNATATSPSATTASSGGDAVAKGSTTLPAGLDDGPRAIESPIDEAAAERGEKLFQTKGCSACHAFGRRVTCPDLDCVTKRRTAKWIQNQILHPEVMTKQDPTARQLFAQFSLQMPNQGLQPAEAAAVLEFLKHKNHEAHD